MASLSPPITYRTRPLVRQTEGSGLGMRSYPFLRPGYGMGLLCNVPLPHTAAQRLLENYPVVENIFYEVGRKYDASTDGRELVNLMLVTKAFHHHAASLLWSDLGHRGLRPLLRIIAVMSIPEFQGGTSVRRFAPDTSPFGLSTSRLWKIFLYYASLVREIQIGPTTLDPFLLPYFHSIIKDRFAIFPSLQRLSWSATIEPNDDLLYALAPTLKQLTVVVRAFDFDSEIQKAFDAWCARFQDKLRVLSPRISNLSVLTTSTYPIGAASTLQYYERLHRLTVSAMVPADEVGDRPIPFDTPALPLKILGLGGFSDVGGVSLCMRVLTICPFALLDTVTISSDSPFKPAGDLRIILHIAPLLLLPRLRRVVLDLPHHGFTLDGTELLDMGRCWRDIVDLQLSFEPLEKSPFPDTYAVRDLLSLCPLLTTLKLAAVDLTDTAENLDHYDWPESSIDYLSITRLYHYQNVSDAAVTAALDAAFPTLIALNFPRDADYVGLGFG